MTETDLAAAIRAAVDHWQQSQPLAHRITELSQPALLSAALAQDAAARLTVEGSNVAALRAFVMSAPYRLLQAAFNPAGLVDTPQDFTPVPDTDGTVAARAAALCAHGLLDLESVSYGTENRGDLFVNLVTMPGDSKYAVKSKRALRGHTDAVTFPFRGDDDASIPRIAPSPDLVTLSGLRNPNHVPTTAMPLDSILGQLSAQQIAELKLPQFYIDSQETFVPGMKAVLGRVHVVVDEPVLRDTPDGPWIRFSHRSVLATVPGGAADTALSAFVRACAESVQHVLVAPGDLLLLNNRSALHGRTTVGTDVGGDSRWLLRTYGLDTSGLTPNKRHGNGLAPHILYP
jgi:hypothetical protein